MKILKKIIPVLMLVALCLCLLTACGNSSTLDYTSYSFDHRLTRDHLEDNGFTVAFFDIENNSSFFDAYIGVDVRGYDGKFLVAEKTVDAEDQVTIGEGDEAYIAKNFVLIVFTCCEGDAKDMYNTLHKDDDAYLNKLVEFLELNPDGYTCGIKGKVVFVGANEALKASQATLEDLAK